MSPSQRLQTGPDRSIARDIYKGLQGFFTQALDMACLAELKLANQRRSDLIALGPDGKISIVEIKSSRADLAADSKWQDYKPFCDRFYFAVKPDFPLEILPASEGLIIADAFGAEILRESQIVPLAAARRKAITLRFARTAAQRLSRRARAQDF